MVMTAGQMTTEIERLRILIARLEGGLDKHVNSDMQVPFVPKHLREDMHGIPIAVLSGQYLRAAGGGFATWGNILEGDLPSHHTTHESGGSDSIKLDDLAAPDNNTDLNATITEHGLCPKLSGAATDYLDGSGAWSVPSVSGTTGSSFTIDSDSTTGKIEISVTPGADKKLSITNTALTDNRTITFQNATGTLAYTSDIPSVYDNIAKGNSKVEVVDSGSGYVSIVIDGAETLRIYTQSICDTNGNELVKFSQTASAVNEITITNAVTTGNPKIATSGGDANVSLDIEAKGNSQINFNVNSVQQAYLLDGEFGTGSAVINAGGGFSVGAAAGASGSFTTADGKAVTVTSGIITAIV